MGKSNASQYANFGSLQNRNKHLLTQAATLQAKYILVVAMVLSIIHVP